MADRLAIEKLFVVVLLLILACICSRYGGAGFVKENVCWWWAEAQALGSRRYQRDQRAERCVIPQLPTSLASWDHVHLMILLFCRCAAPCFCRRRSNDQGGVGCHLRPGDLKPSHLMSFTRCAQFMAEFNDIDTNKDGKVPTLAFLSVPG